MQVMASAPTRDKGGEKWKKKFIAGKALYEDDFVKTAEKGGGAGNKREAKK